VQNASNPTTASVGKHQVKERKNQGGITPKEWGGGPLGLGGAAHVVKEEKGTKKGREKS